VRVVARATLAQGAGIVLVPRAREAHPMHMHPTVTHAAADHRRHDYLAEAATHWQSRPASEQVTIRRRTGLVWRVTVAIDSALTWLTREFAPTPSWDPAPDTARPLAVARPR
jgi:hypothetical protein